MVRGDRALKRAASRVGSVVIEEGRTDEAATEVREKGSEGQGVKETRTKGRQKEKRKKRRGRDE
jgi:hypothetical protein